MNWSVFCSCDVSMGSNSSRFLLSECREEHENLQPQDEQESSIWRAHEVLRAFLRGYGQAPDPDLPRRVLAWTLLHKFSHLVWYLHILGGPDSRDLEDLARVWFGVS